MSIENIPKGIVQRLIRAAARAREAAKHFRLLPKRVTQPELCGAVGIAPDVEQPVFNAEIERQTKQGWLPDSFESKTVSLIAIDKVHSGESVPANLLRPFRAGRLKTRLPQPV